MPQMGAPLRMHGPDSALEVKEADARHPPAASATKTVTVVAASTWEGPASETACIKFTGPSYHPHSAKCLPNTCQLVAGTCQLFGRSCQGSAPKEPPTGAAGQLGPGQHPRRRRLEPNAKLLCADNFRAQRARWVASSPDGLGFRLGGGGRWLRWPA